MERARSIPGQRSHMERTARARERAISRLVPDLHRRARPSALFRESSPEKVRSESSRFDSLSGSLPGTGISPRRMYVPVPAFSSRSRIARRFPKSDFPARSSDWGRCLPPWMRDRGIRFPFPVPAAVELAHIHIYIYFFLAESSSLRLPHLLLLITPIGPLNTHRPVPDARFTELALSALNQPRYTYISAQDTYTVRIRFYPPLSDADRPWGIGVVRRASRGEFCLCQGRPFSAAGTNERCDTNFRVT